MLIYWLFIILVLNLIISYKATKCIISPPLFFNLGFVVACYFAILFYKEWDMQLLRMNEKEDLQKNKLKYMGGTRSGKDW